MGSEDNLRYLQRGGDHYIIGRKIKSGETEVRAALAQRGPYTQINDKLSAKEIVLGDGAKRKRLVMIKNSEEQERQRMVRDEIIAAIEQKITAINGRRNRSHSREVCELKSHAVCGKYVKELLDGHLKIYKTKAAAESKYDGKFLLETSDDTLSIEDVVLGYKQLI